MAPSIFIQQSDSKIDNLRPTRGRSPDFLSVRLITGSDSQVSYNAHVMIAKDLLEILVCPACKQELEYRQNPESLKCKQCHRVYAIKDDIPIMLIDEATIEP